jgi:hypothetical protein
VYVNERAFSLELSRALGSFVVAATEELDVCSELSRRMNLHEGSRLRHHHGCPNTEARRVQRHGLRVIAGARSDHSASPLGVAQKRKQVGGAAFLERTGALQILEFQKKPRGGQLG